MVSHPPVNKMQFLTRVKENVKVYFILDIHVYNSVFTQQRENFLPEKIFLNSYLDKFVWTIQIVQEQPVCKMLRGAKLMFAQVL